MRYFFSNDTTTTETYTLSLHDALPISRARATAAPARPARPRAAPSPRAAARRSNGSARSEEHTSELQSRENLVCRLLLEKKKALVPVHAQLLREHARPSWCSGALSTLR